MALSDPHDLNRWPDSPPPERYRRVPDATWEAARDDYLSGWTAPEVCERHGIGLSNLRTRAREEGWRRSDQPEAERPSFKEEAAADTGPMPSWREAAEQSRRTMHREQKKGNVLQAHRWLRLYRDQSKEAEREEAAERIAAAKARQDKDPFILALRQSNARLAEAIAHDLDEDFRRDMAEQEELERLDDLDEEKVHEVHPLQPPLLAGEEAWPSPDGRAGGGESCPLAPPSPASPAPSPASRGGL